MEALGTNENTREVGSARNNMIGQREETPVFRPGCQRVVRHAGH
jgi:hypothetical protein